MKFRRHAFTAPSTVRAKPQTPLSDESRQADLQLGLNILADVAWKLVLALAILDEHRDLLQDAQQLGALHDLSDAISSEVDALLSPLERSE